MDEGASVDGIDSELIGEVRTRAAHCAIVVCLPGDVQVCALRMSNPRA